jgi:DNA repair protein SbcC/Rad50
MFSFLFKRSAKPSPAAVENRKNPEKDDASALAAEKTAAIARAQELAGDEAAAVEFILQCRFADARLQAANHVHSKQLLGRLAQAMRETDRRVAKLAQQRLDAIKQKEDTERDAAVCIERIRSLAKEPVILPNQLSEIERSWSALRAVSQELTSDFEHSRAALQQRLHEQTALQRSVIEIRNAAQALSREAEELSPSSSLDALNAQLGILAAQFSVSRASSEALSLPKNLLSDIETVFAHTRRLLEQLAHRRAAIAAHEQAYAAWEANPALVPDMNALRRELRSLPALDAADAHLFEQDLQRLQARFPKPVRTQERDSVKRDKPDMGKYRPVLEALEHALEEGALQAATEHEKELRAADHLALTWKPEEEARLTKARAELSRLKSWARWGGKVSREELIKAAEELPDKEASPGELAKKIGSLRSQWKSMDAASGAAGKDAWQRFDAACTAAYVPVAAHFSALAAERKANLEKAQSLLSQIRNFAPSELAADAVNASDWKNITTFRARLLQAWRELGPVDRKDKKMLDREFSEAMTALSGPLAVVQLEEMKRREDLIDQVKRIDPSGKNAMTSVRQIQQQWQQQAKSMPLERKEEQALWLRFRAACDELVAHRQADMQQVDAQHAENDRLKTALCERLEAEAHGASENLEQVLNEVEQQWKSIGPVTRAGEPALKERYQHAVTAMRSRLEEDRQAVQRRQFEQLFKKFALCGAAEQMLSSTMHTGIAADATALEEEWGRCDAVPDDLERVLHDRFRAALAAIRSGDARHASLLEQNRATLERDMLRMEINLGIESPPEFAAERLRLQVASLQESLKSGGQRCDRHSLLLKLCELPAFHDDAGLARIERVIGRLGMGDR